MCVTMGFSVFLFLVLNLEVESSDSPLQARRLGTRKVQASLSFSDCPERCIAFSSTSVNDRSCD